jgi:hypothetical protein
MLKDISTRLTLLSFSCDVEGRGEVPHLYGTVAVSGEDEPPRPCAHSARTLALVDAERCDNGVIDGANYAYPVSKTIEKR